MYFNNDLVDFNNDLVDLFLLLLLHLDPDLEPCTTEYTSTLWNWLCATFYLYTSVLSTKYTSVISHCLFPSDLPHSHLGVVHPIRVSFQSRRHDANLNTNHELQPRSIGRSGVHLCSKRKTICHVIISQSFTFHSRLQSH